MRKEADQLSELEALAEKTAARAARAREHAIAARERAQRDAERGDEFAADLHLREAFAHERASAVNAQTAALYRQRAGRRRALRTDIEDG